MTNIISIEERRAGEYTGPKTNDFAKKVGWLAGEVILILKDANPADFETIRKEILQVARKHAYKSKLKGVKRP